MQGEYVNLVEETLTEKEEGGMKIQDTLTEAADETIKKIGDVIKKNPKVGLMGLRPELEKMFKKKDIDFTMVGAAHFQIKHKDKKIMIVNKKYVDGADLIVGELAVGYM